MKWMILYQKEMTDFWRSYKWFWLPLVFVIIGVMQPITTYYQPQIMDLAGVPKEIVMSMPQPDAAQVMIKSLSQYNTLGVLIIVLASMSIVSLERTSGRSQLILVRPVSFSSFIISKWFALVTMFTASFSIGYLATWYYTNLLIGKLSFFHLVSSFIIYLVWLIFIMTLTIVFSSTFKGQGSTAFLTLLTSITLSILTSTFAKGMYWSPATLTTHANMLLEKGELGDRGWWSIAVTLLLIVILLIGAIQIFKKHDLSVNH